MNAELANRMRITEETATDYLRFFCQFVHGEEAFLVLSSVDELSWKELPNADDGRAHRGGMIVDPAARLEK